MLDSFANIVISQLADWCEIVLLSEGELKIQESVIAHRDPKQLAWAKKFREVHTVDWNQTVGVARVVRSGKPELHAAIDPNSLTKMIQDPKRREAIAKFGVHSAIIVPLLSYGRVIGALSIISCDSRRSYNELDLSLVQDLAKRASFAIENSRLFRKAQEASQAKSAFLANMSHEIRTPLGAMLGFAELLNEEGLQAEQKRFLATLSRNGQQLLRIVDEILDLSKVESDRIHIENVEFSLGGLVQEVISLLRLQAEEKNLGFHVNSLVGIPDRIVGDPNRLRQILINVIGNAIKFTLNGSVDVHFELHTRAAHPDKPVLEISVIDTGIGVAREQRDKLFQPFVQADNSMTRRFGGTGLGLFLSRRLARLMGGDVVLGPSQPLKGSQFIITVTVEVCESPTAKIPGLVIAGDATPDFDGKVLIVDDAPDNRLYLSRMGFNAETAATGKEAVQMAMEKSYKVILMDVQMPEMDGFEAVHELRALNYQGPIVALTAHTMKGDRERCLEGGFDDYLGKPVDRDLLRQSLVKFIQG